MTSINKDSPTIPLAKPQTLSGASKCAIVASIIGIIAGIVIVALGSVNIFGSGKGFIGSITGGGLATLISGGSLTWLVIVNWENPNSKEAVSTSSKSQDKQQRPAQLDGISLHTNVDKYANQCIEQLIQNNVSLDRYKHLIVWEPSRQRPDVFSADGVASNLRFTFKTLAPKSILLLAVIDSAPEKSNPTDLKNSILTRKLLNARGADSPVVLHFVPVEKCKIELSAELCHKIAHHDGETL